MSSHLSGLSKFSSCPILNYAGAGRELITTRREERRLTGEVSASVVIAGRIFLNPDCGQSRIIEAQCLLGRFLSKRCPSPAVLLRNSSILLYFKQLKAISH